MRLKPTRSCIARGSCSGPVGGVKTSVEVLKTSLGPRWLISAETEVIKVLLGLGDLDGTHAERIVVLPEADTLGGGTGPGAGQKTLELHITRFVDGRGMNMLIPMID